MLLNLLANAIKYNRPHGRVEVSTTAVGDQEVSIAITDTGMGIPAEDLPHLFTPFDRLGRESSPIEGSGLGLTLTKSLVTVMSGRLEVDSVVGTGSTFTVTLPGGSLSESPGLEAPGAVDSEDRSTADGAPMPLILLYIEDNRSNVDLVRAAIRHRPAWVVTHVAEGAEGLKLAVELAPTLILLDLHLPDLDGAEVLHRLKADPASVSIPVAILSADATRTLPAQMRAAGADQFLTKPVDLEEFFALLDATAKEGRQATRRPRRLTTRPGV